ASKPIVPAKSRPLISTLTRCGVGSAAAKVTARKRADLSPAAHRGNRVSTAPDDPRAAAMIHTPFERRCLDRSISVWAPIADRNKREKCTHSRHFDGQRMWVNPGT